MTFMPSSLTKRPAVTTLALFAVVLILGSILLGLTIGTISAYVIDVGPNHVRSRP